MKVKALVTHHPDLILYTLMRNFRILHKHTVSLLNFAQLPLFCMVATTWLMEQLLCQKIVSNCKSVMNAGIFGGVV